MGSLASAVEDNVYHGSNAEYIELDPERVGSFYDFGEGFYVTRSKDEAINWIHETYSGEDKGWLHTYTVNNMLIANTLDLYKYPSLVTLCIIIVNTYKVFENSVRLSLLKVINNNVKLATDYLDKMNICIDDYDIIKGGRLDSRYRKTLKEFLTDNLKLDSCDLLLNNSVYKEQICIKPKYYSNVIESDPELVPINKSTASDIELKQNELYNNYKKLETKNSKTFSEFVKEALGHET